MINRLIHEIPDTPLLESIYRECLVLELRTQQLRVVTDQHVPLDYKGHRLSNRLRLDLLVEECVVVELKAVEQMQRVHSAQVISYLKLTESVRNFVCGHSMRSVYAPQTEKPDA